jgi:hypothetical protein
MTGSTAVVRLPEAGANHEFCEQGLKDRETMKLALKIFIFILASGAVLLVILFGFSVNSVLEEDEFRDRVNEC